MATVQEMVQVEPKTREAGRHVVHFLSEFKKALKAGNPISEAIMIAQAALVDLAPVLSSLPDLKAEMADNKSAEGLTIFLVGVDVYNALLS